MTNFNDKSDDMIIDLAFESGFNDFTRPTRVGNSQQREYLIWRGMIQRVQSNGQSFKNESYKGCSISENFKDYSFFYDWCNKQKAFKLKDSQLDKDFLVRFNKHYSEDNCLILPKELNTVLIGCSKPVHGYYHNVKANTYKVILNIGQGRAVRLGTYKTAVEAALVYKAAKENHIQNLANKYKNYLDEHIYQKFIDFQIELKI